MPSAPRIAIIGAGPSGFYAAEALQKTLPDVVIDLFDRLPTPFGLVRGGVAPDHPKIKSVTRIYDRIASHPGFRFFGHVTVGLDVTVPELHAAYHAVIIATGAQTDRQLGIPGEQLAGSHAATDFVGWYNGHPDFSDRRFDLTQHEAAVIGLGNVAIDVTRILARDPETLAPTDLVSPALRALHESALTSVHVIGRRGPVQAACTTPELRELGELEGVDAIVDPADLVLDPVSAAHLATGDDRTATKNMEIFRRWAERGPTGARRSIVFHFAASPVEVLGDARVQGLRIVRNDLVPDDSGSVRAVPTNLVETLDVGLIFRSVGYRGVPIDGVPFDDRRGVIPNAAGRVVDDAGEAVPGVYVCGWIKRGPSGVIGTNKSCAADTVALLIDDLTTGVIDVARQLGTAVDGLLLARGARIVDWSGWQALDRAEIEAGASAGRPREKVISVAEMLDIVAAGNER
ncbi:MAG: FAD-dependent oxidoreductase [Gemmatimonadales bacterium]|nr:FAD-dependent oxidoreductase [Gemmatimonadales bacterium]